MGKECRGLGPLLRGDRLLVGIGAGDALTARLAERAGFDLVWSSSFCISAAHGVPDASLLSMTEYLDAARSMALATELPVLADLDTGYGNANNVIHAVERFERAGVAGLCMEDKRFPKDTSLLEGGRQELAGVDEFRGKIEAAVDARNDPELAVVARTEALIAGLGQEEALRRAHAYASAGADAILVHSKSRTPDEVVTFARAWDGTAPLVLIPTTYPDLTEQHVRELGNVRVVIYANQAVRASVRAQEAILGRIRASGGIHEIDDLVCPVEHIFELQGVARLKEREQRYVRRG